MSYNLKAEMARASRINVYGSIDLADEKRGYIRANSASDVANVAIGRLRQLSEGIEADNGIPASQSITALHFKKAIHDLSKTSKKLHRAGNEDAAKLAADASGILVNAYIRSTDDPDVFRAMPPETILDLDTLG